MAPTNEKVTVAPEDTCLYLQAGGLGEESEDPWEQGE